MKNSLDVTEIFLMDMDKLACSNIVIVNRKRSGSNIDNDQGGIRKKCGYFSVIVSNIEK